ncbi:hypothetical protein LSM04_007453 [Trypanosoma melophagium]|uniref:uncharacterized protein n=1 Tax=Trypanosoma melophagium TaxID=715481 RepID=UPI00351A60BD|nr:hypothetical protein LSM04_007453 [Trypanosoma melophagium]
MAPPGAAILNRRYAWNGLQGSGTHRKDKSRTIPGRGIGLNTFPQGRPAPQWVGALAKAKTGKPKPRHQGDRDKKRQIEKPCWDMLSLAPRKRGGGRDWTSDALFLRPAAPARHILNNRKGPMKKSRPTIFNASALWAPRGLDKQGVSRWLGCPVPGTFGDGPQKKGRKEITSLQRPLRPNFGRDSSAAGVPGAVGVWCVGAVCAPSLLGFAFPWGFSGRAPWDIAEAVPVMGRPPETVSSAGLSCPAICFMHCGKIGITRSLGFRESLATEVWNIERPAPFGDCQSASGRPSFPLCV